MAQNIQQEETRANIILKGRFNSNPLAQSEAKVPDKEYLEEEEVDIVDINAQIGSGNNLVRESSLHTTEQVVNLIELKELLEEEMSLNDDDPKKFSWG